MRNTYKILVGNPEENRGRPRCRWNDNIKCAVTLNNKKMWIAVSLLMIGKSVGFL
jgi:hypothetical protein